MYHAKKTLSKAPSTPARPTESGSTPASQSQTRSLRACFEAIGIHPDRPESLPFVLGDATAGSETELQAAVIGNGERVDLPRTIRASSFFANVIRQAVLYDFTSIDLDKNRLDPPQANMWRDWSEAVNAVDCGYCGRRFVKRRPAEELAPAEPEAGDSAAAD